MKTHHVCPKCGRKWRCKEAEKCLHWEKDGNGKLNNCPCSHCDGFNGSAPECEERMWSVS